MWQTSKLVLIVVGLFFSIFMSAYGKVEVSRNNGVASYQFNVEKVDFNQVELEKNAYLKASLKGIDGYQAVMHRVGFPELPAVSFFVQAGASSDIQVLIDERRVEKSRHLLTIPIAPAQESLPKIKGAAAPFAMNRAAYQSATFFPLTKYSVVEAGSIAGVKQFLVTVYPFAYNPKSGQYKVIPNFEVQVKEAAPVVRTGAETFVFIIGSKYINNSELQRYMNFKKELGFNVMSIVVGTDITTPESIRAKLQEIYKNPSYNLKYALIIGDIEDVPAKQANFLSNGKMVTDHYYRAIDMDSYVQDINGPDIGVGRVTVKNDTELDGVIAKFFKYQKGQFGRTDWFSHLSFLATDDRWQVAEATHNYAVDNFFAPRGYTGNFPAAVQNGGDKLYAITNKVTKPQVIDRINEGRFIINYSGHGATTYWDAPNFTQTDVRNLKDPDVLPFVISNACITGQFNIDESYAETWIKHPYGAIMFWGSMDSSYWDEDDVLEKAMYHGIFDENRRSFSSLTQNALSGVWRFYNGEIRSKYYWETYTIFGDPSIELRLAEPKIANLSAPEAIPFGVEQLTLALTDETGAPIANTRVAISHVEGSYSSSAYTNESGEVTLDLKGAMVADHYKVIAYGNDLLTVEKSIFVSSPDYPFYILKSFNNSGSELSVRPGQEFALDFTIENVSPVASTGGSVEVESVSNEFEIVSGSALIPAVGGNSTVAIKGLTLRARNTLSHETMGSVVLRWTSNEGESYTASARIKVVKAELSIVSVDFGDADHPADNGFEPNSQGLIYLTVRNNGSFPVENALLHVVPVGDKFTASATIRIEYLAPGEQIRLGDALNSVAIDLLESSQNDDVLQFNLAGSSDSPFGAEMIEATSSFVVGKYGYREVEFNEIGLALVDQGTANYEFSGVDGIKAIKDLTVHVTIQHSYVGDLTLTLFHSSGVSVVLRKKQGGSNDDISEEYGPDALNAFDGLPSDGTWRLEINDSSKSDTGFLNGLKLKIKGFI